MQDVGGALQGGRRHQGLSPFITRGYPYYISTYATCSGSLPAPNVRSGVTVPSCESCVRMELSAKMDGAGDFMEIINIQIIQEYSPYGICIYMGGSWNGGSPIKWMVYFMEHPN